MHAQPKTFSSRQSGPTHRGEINRKTIKLSTINIEGVKSNIPFLIEMSRTEQIICMQEHWFNDYEKSAIENLVPNYKARRGKGGVSIMWPNQWSHFIKRLDGGNERIIGIELKGSEPLFIFNVYMPTHESNSMSNYNKHLDILHTLLVKYSSMGTVIICGDLNGTLCSDRSNRHDCSLKEFVKEHNLSWHEESMGSESTFVSHNGCGRSQIDYILCSSSSDVLKTTTVEEKHYLNQSAHTVVSSLLDMKLNGNLNVEKRNV